MLHEGNKVTTFQKRIAELLDESDQNISDLAKRLHVSRQTLSAWKSGTRSPKEPTIIAIADAFGVTVPWLMGFDVNKHKSEKPIEEERKTTPEIKILARGMHKMTEEQQKQLLDVARIMFAKFFEEDE